jgi:hypothetical protein
MHQVNITIHVIAGTIAMLIGIILLIRPKATKFHLKWGRVFVYLLTLVNVSAFLGWLFFRSNPFLLMLTLLASYNTFAGYRIIKLKTNRGGLLDLLAPVAALSTGLIYLFHLMHSDSNWSPAVIYPTLSALIAVTVYDIVKHLLFHPFIKQWWLYEHIYKIVSAFGAVLSAFVGTVLPNFKPYSQAGPGILCWIIIIGFILVEVQKKKRHSIV